MSAFVVGPDHIDAILTYAQAARRDYGNAAEYTATGRKLLAANVASVCYRYERDTPADHIDPERYTFRPLNRNRSAVEIIKACDCLAYQCSELPEWVGSEAYQLLNAIRSRAVYCLPGYSDAAWEISRAA
jgi:hypothetical protein